MHETFLGRTPAVTVAELPAATGEVRPTRRTDADAEATNVIAAAAAPSAAIPRIICSGHGHVCSGHQTTSSAAGVRASPRAGQDYGAALGNLPDAVPEGPGGRLRWT